MSELHFRSAAALSRMIRRREIGSRELLEHFIARAEAHNPKINAIVARDFERARKAADAADAALARGEMAGPLHGLPMTIKDAYEVADLRTTGGAPEYADHIPVRSAEAVARIERAGAVIFGKTNVPYLSGDLQTYNSVYEHNQQIPRTSPRPAARRRFGGGARGGAHGARIAASSRLDPHTAQLCGRFRHKTMFRHRPQARQYPGPPGSLAETDLSVAGPLGRSAEDLDLLLSVIAGPAAPAAAGWRLDLPRPRALKPRELRVAVWIDDPFCDIDRETAGLLHNAVRALEEAGARVDRAARPAFTLAESSEIYLTMLHSVVAAGFPASIKTRWEALKRELDPGDKSHRALQARGGTISHAEWMAMNELREGLRAAWAELFRSPDVVLAPTLMRPAFAHDQRSNWHERRLTVNGVEREYMDVLIWAGPAVVACRPATVAPAGLTGEGLPVGIQILGPYLEDRTTIAVAGMIEELLGGFRPPPGF